MKRVPIPTFSISIFSSFLLHFFVWAFFFLKPSLTKVLKELPRPRPVMVTLAVEPVKKVKQIVEQEETEPQKPNEKANYLSASNSHQEKETQAQQVGAFSNSPDRDPQSETHESDFKVPAGKQSKANDYLKDVQRSAQTLLNTKEMASYQYHIKIRNAVHSQWTELIQNRKDEIQIERSHSTKPAWEQKTKLLFSLSSAGNLLNIRIVDSSGLPSVDQIVLDAFERAQPFSPPPAELLDSNGEFRMQWDFVIENSF